MYMIRVDLLTPWEKPSKTSFNTPGEEIVNMKDPQIMSQEGLVEYTEM